MDGDVAQLGPGATTGDVKRDAMDVRQEVKPECTSRIDGIRPQHDDAMSGMNTARPVPTSPRLPSPQQAQDPMRGVGRNRGGR